MTSHSTASAACPEGHGLMVHVDYEMCFAPANQLVVAVVEYRATEKGIVPWGYAIDEAAKESLPHGDRLGDQIEDLEVSEQLISIYDVMDAGSGYLRIDDKRPGHNWGYMVWLDNVRKDGVSFIPGTVYHWFDDKQEDHVFPRLETFEEVVALLDDPTAKFITGYSHEIAKKKVDDVGVVDELGDLKNRVVIYDRGAIQRYARERQLQPAVPD